MMGITSSWLVLIPYLIMSCSALNITSDQSSLLALKSQLGQNERNVLATNWSSDTHTCSWIGITCSSKHQRVAAINISNMDLSGTIPPQLGNLSVLVSLDMSHNNFRGVLPGELANLKRLRFISFSFNRFSGQIPSWLGKLHNLQHLFLENCSFTGSIPPSLSNLSELETLSLASNSLQGSIPVEIGNLSALKSLLLRDNKLSGTIPIDIFNISTLEKADFTSNRLFGVLPVNMCRYLKKLSYFSVYSNQMYGQIPSSINECSQLQTLILQFNKFTGPIPKQIGNLSLLLNLYLGDNNLKGEVPAEIYKLPQLEYLTLDELGLSGPVSSFIHNMSTLQWFYIGQNNITGNLPQDICLLLPALQGLYLSSNQLTGSIPRGLGNCSSLMELYMDINMFTGEIPSEIGNLPYLEVLVLGTNHLTGRIPSTIFNISTLNTLSVRENHIIGSLPATFGQGLPNLQAIFLGQNNLTGPIPDSISNASNLHHLSLVANKLNGYIPNTLGELNFLDFLNLGENNFTSESSHLSFIVSLTKCRRLRIIWFQNNSFTGFLPDSIGNFSSTLEQIDATNNGIRGNIPEEIGNISSLVSLYMDNNGVAGFIPTTIRGLKNLQALSLIGNMLSGPIPDGICQLLNLGELTFSKNKLSGPLPPCFGNMTALRYLNLDTNELNSSLPPTIAGLKDLLKFNLFSNFLSGPLPQEIGNLKVVSSIDLSVNELSGGVPSTIVGLNELINLSLAHNRLQGSIPDTIGTMLSLERLDLSHNHLTGVIPKSMEKLQHLEYLNLSFNKLTGEIPTGGPFAHFNYQSFVSNDELCGPPLPVCHHHKSRQKEVRLVSIILASIAIVFIILALMVCIFRGKNKAATPVDLIPALMPERIRYLDVERATDGFSRTNLIGIGSFGSVYKGLFSDGTVLAVKVFNLQIERAFRSFDTECEVLRSLRHRNLTKVISSCSNIEFRALILEYMPNGSLEKWLYSHNERLNLQQRLSIMIDVASAIDYLHHGYTTPVVHCDLKPSNVLLDESMVAHVCDFGIAKLVNAEDSEVQTKTLATFGYIAPEYGSEGLVSTRCDVYSFGIMVMETLTRKRPTDDMFIGGVSLRGCINDSYPHSLSRFIDDTLLKSEEGNLDKNVECISLIMKLALDCSVELPGERTNMKDALASLQKIRNQFFSRRNTR